MQNMTNRRRSKQPAESTVQSRPGDSDSALLVTAQERSPPAPSVHSTTPSAHNTNWLRKATAKLKAKQKENDASTDPEKVARVETPDFELTDVEYFRACIHHFKWTMPPAKQLRKCFTRQFTRALMRNATATNRSGQCFLAFVLHEAKKFFTEKQISTKVHYHGRLEVYELGRCLGAVLQMDVADLLVQTIGAQQLHVGRDLARTQCLHDRSFPDWIRLISERVLLNPYMRAPAREGLSVLLGMLDLHSSLRLSDEARQSLASGPWSKKHMKIARRMVKRRRASRKATRPTLPNPLTAHLPSMSVSGARHSAGILEPRDDNNEAESFAIYDADVARQHMESAQSSKQPTRRSQVFRNGAPHSLYATEALLEEEIQVLERRLEARRAFLQSPPGELPSAAPPRSTFSLSSKVSTSILSRMRTKAMRMLCGLCRKKRQPQVKSRTQAGVKKPRIKRHRGSWKKQEAALTQLETTILALQRRSTLLMEEIEFLQENRPRPATVAVPSRSAQFRQWKRQQARSPIQLSRSSSHQATSSSEQAESSAELARSSNEREGSSATQATSLDPQATIPDQTATSAHQSVTSSESLFGPFTSTHGVASRVESQRQSQHQDDGHATLNQTPSQAPSSIPNPDPTPGPVAVLRGGASKEQSQPRGRVLGLRARDSSQAQARTPVSGSSRFTSLRSGPPRNPSQDRANVYREQGQDQAQSQSQGASREQGQTQQQNQAAPRIPSDSPPTYAQSERASQRQGDRASQKKGKKLRERVKKILRIRKT